jgi:hypothetical protein
MKALATTANARTCLLGGLGTQAVGRTQCRLPPRHLLCAASTLPNIARSVTWTTIVSLGNKSILLLRSLRGTFTRGSGLSSVLAGAMRTQLVMGGIMVGHRIHHALALK